MILHQKNPFNVKSESTLKKFKLAGNYPKKNLSHRHRLHQWLPKTSSFTKAVFVLCYWVFLVKNLTHFSVLSKKWLLSKKSIGNKMLKLSLGDCMVLLSTSKAKVYFLDDNQKTNGCGAACEGQDKVYLSH